MTTSAYPRPARQKGTHIRGSERADLRRALAREYRAGASIRAVAVAHDIAYGTARALLIEEDVPLRTRVGTRGGPR